MTVLPVQVEKINGLPDEKAACGIFTKRITFEGGVAGTLVCTILVGGGEGEDNQTYLRDIFEIASQKIEESRGGPLEVLKDALGACRVYIEQRGIEASLVNALVYKNAFYFSRFKDKVRVWVFTSQKSTELKFDLGSGLIHPGQIFLIGTERFFSTFDTSPLTLGTDVDLAGIIDGLATEITADEEGSEIGVAIIYVKEEENEPGAAAKVDEDRPSEEQQQQEVPPEHPEEAEVAVGESVLAAHQIESRSGKFGAGKFAGRILTSLWREAGRLRRGDIGAVLRLRRNIVFVVALIVLVLAVSAFLTLRSVKEKEKLVQFNEHMKTASAHYSEGEAILELNKTRAREALADAEREVKAALALKPDDSEAKSLADKILGKLKDTENVSTVDFETFADLGESVVDFSSDTNGFVGFGERKMYRINNDGNVDDEVSIPSANFGFFYSESGFVVNGDKVFKVGFGDSKASDIAQVRGVLDIWVFLGNVYLLGQDQIAKYVPIEGGYTKSVDYLNNPETFSNNSHFAIDGSVWVTNGKNINKYTRGAKESFEVSGVLDANLEFGEIYTDSNSDNLYVVDVSNSALLVVDKGGIYQKAYQSGEFARATDIVVDEENGKMYVAVGSKVLIAGL